jgi:tRNA A-37 threonylcarbamoyl transferase component Bud32/sugar lactone lactonase YvrE
VPADPKQVKAIFLAAVEKATLEERAVFLNEACSGDEELRRRADELLRAHDEPGGLPGVADRDRPTGSAADDALMSFLAPSSEPGSLGRLDHYEILEVIGRGGTGIVLRARDSKLLRVVALKVLAAALAASGSARQRFAREARAAAAVRDDHVIDIHAVCDDGPLPYLVMEFIDGCTLETLLRKGGPLEVKQILRIGIQAASGLAAAHKQGLIHRDVKPANILLENGVQRVKITDFGLARAVDDASLTQSGLIAGTPLYMAPEQAAGEPIDPRTDLFSLGSVLYELCTGRPAFRASTTMAVLRRVCDETPRPIRAVNPDVPEPLCRLIERLQAKKPADRPASAKEVAETLTRLLAGLNGGRSLPEDETALLQGPARRAGPARRKWLWTAAALVLLLAIGLSLGLTGKRLTNLVTTILGLKGGGPAGEAKSEAPPAPPGDPTPPDATAAKFKKSLVGHTQGVISVAYSPDGRLLASGDEGGEVRVWNVLDGTPRYVLPARGPALHGLAFSPDGKSLLTTAARGNGDINIWDAETGKPDDVLKGHTSGVHEVSFGPDGETLVSAGWDATIRVWDFAARREVQTIPAPDGRWIRSVVVSASGKIAVGGGKVFLFEADGQLVKTFDVEAAPLCFSPDGRLLAGTTWKQGRVTVWDVKTGEQVGTWQAHNGLANGVAFSRDGQVLATAGSDGAVRLWNPATQRELGELRHEGHTYQLAFAPDGATLATTGMENRLVKLWDVSFLRKLKLSEKGK